MTGRSTQCAVRRRSYDQATEQPAFAQGYGGQAERLGERNLDLGTWNSNEKASVSVYRRIGVSG